MQNNENNYEGAKRKERKKNKKIYLNSKKVRGHSFMSFTKKSEIRTPLSDSIHKYPTIV